MNDYDISSLVASEGESFSISGVSVTYNWHNDPVESHVSYYLSGIVQVMDGSEDEVKEGTLQKEDVVVFVDKDEINKIESATITNYHFYDMEDGSGLTVSDTIGANHGVWTVVWQNWSNIPYAGVYSTGVFEDLVYWKISQASLNSAVKSSRGQITMYVYNMSVGDRTHFPLSWKHSSGNYGFIEIQEATQDFYAVIDGVLIGDGGNPIPTYEWTKLTLKWDGTNGYLYINDILSKATPCTKNFSNLDDSDYFFVGKYDALFNYNFTGYVDNLTFSSFGVDLDYKNALKNGNYININTTTSGVFQISNVIRNPGHFEVQAKRVFL